MADLPARREGSAMSEPMRRAIEAARRHCADAGLDLETVQATGTRAAVALRNRELGALAVRLRRSGCDFRTIASVLRVKETKARYLVAKALDELNAQTATDAAGLKAMELAKLDAWEEALQAKAESGSPEAVQTLLSLQGRRMALHGFPISRAGVMAGDPTAAPGLPQGASPDAGGVATLTYLELRAGVTGDVDVDRLRSLVGAAVASGAARLALPAPRQAVTLATGSTIDATAEPVATVEHAQGTSHGDELGEPLPGDRS